MAGSLKRQRKNSKLSRSQNLPSATSGKDPTQFPAPDRLWEGGRLEHMPWSLARAQDCIPIGLHLMCRVTRNKIETMTNASGVAASSIIVLQWARRIPSRPKVALAGTSGCRKIPKIGMSIRQSFLPLELDPPSSNKKLSACFCQKKNREN